MKVKVSIIIVHYKAQKELRACLQSIKRQKFSQPYEVIIVNNDTSDISKEVRKILQNIIYIKNKVNVGFGAGNNVGVSRARGEYLFMLNPDTKLEANALFSLTTYLDNHNGVGIAAPLLLDADYSKSPIQGTKTLGYLEGIVSLSFLNKYFPRNPISRQYLLLDWNKQTDIDVDVVPGAAFMIRKQIYEAVGGFDEQFFLYFEEVDLCRRIKKMGYKLIVTPTAKVVHIGGQSTKNLKNPNKFFYESRKKYFMKYYGFFAAWLLELFLVRVRSIGRK